MNSHERMIAAMNLQTPDRAPVMCQLSIGHLLALTGMKPVDLWHTAEGCAGAWIAAQERYSFDGILLNLCGPPRDALNQIDRIEDGESGQTIHWKPGAFDYARTFFPYDDLPRNVWPDGEPFLDFASFDPDRDIPDRLQWLPVSQGMKVPIDAESRFDTLAIVKAKKAGTVTLHGEAFSPWDYHLALFGAENGLMAILEDAGKVHAILDRHADLIIDWALAQIAQGVDAVTLSSPWAGAGFLSRKHYQEFILPYEKRINTAIRGASAFCCTHTCGSLGDRLDLLLESNTNGIECLDPPPLGNVELSEAKKITRGKAFIKGNIDSVNVLLHGSIDDVKRDAKMRLDAAMEGGGYILSTACSVAPHVPPENLEALCEVAEEHGRYE